MTATISLVSLEPLLPAIQPHPELVAAQRPTPAEVVQVAALFGCFLDDEDRFRPVTIGQRGV